MRKCFYCWYSLLLQFATKLLHQCLGKLQENRPLCLVLACLNDVIPLTSVFGSGNSKFLAKEESNALPPQRFEKELRGGRKFRTEREETDKYTKTNQYKD